MKNSYSVFFTFASLVLLALVVSVFTACGRRGDPVAISPSAVTIMEEDAETPAAAEGDTQDLTGAEHRAISEEATSRSDIPVRLIAVYTQESVVLTWDEIVGRSIKRYRVYRSEGDGYHPIGESVTPAFTDRSIEKNREYSYKVTAVGMEESPASAEIKIRTEMR